MPSTGIEPAYLRSLARRSNQLSYAAATWATQRLTQTCSHQLRAKSNNK